MQILVLYTGGVPFFAGQTTQHITKALQNFLELQLVANMDITILQNIPGADITYDVCTVLSQHIYDNYDAYDGFVIIHGLDHVLYTANLLTFLFSTLGKPVIFTGCALSDELFLIPQKLSQAEQHIYHEMSLRTNLVTAVQLATMNCSGVMLAYSPRIVRAVRAIETTNTENSNISSWQEPNVAEVQFGIHLSSTIPTRHDLQPQLAQSFATDIYTAELYPGMSLPPNLEQNYRALVLKGLYEQLLPSHFIIPKNIPVIIQAQHSEEIPTTAQNIIIARSTWSVAITKTMAAIEQTESLAEFKTVFTDNRFGEFN